MFLNTQRTLLRGRTLLALVAVGTAEVTLAACSSTGSSGSSGSASGPVTVGELFPFTGAKAQLSDWGTHGVDTGMYEVNHNGGVLGQQMKSVSADDAADSVDALPALRKLLLSDPKVVIGPFSPTIEAVINQFTPNHVADFMMGGTAQLDNMNVPYVFRTFSSDSTEAVAMAYYAIQKGYKTASLIFDNSANSQGFVAPLTAAYKKLGGTVLATNTIVPAQSSYRSELVNSFANHPQVVFSSFDTQTASTLWSNAGQLGYLNTPWVADDLAAGAEYAKAFGPTAPTNLVAALPASPTGPAYQHFLDDYNALFHTNTPLSTTPNSYDAVVISALAMTEAKSTDPKVWASHVTTVASPPGEICSDYATCVGLLKAGKKINYEGAGGSNDFNAHHNVFGDFSIVGFQPDLTTTKQVGQVTADQVAKNAG